jgi:hypothetical protein
MRFAVVRLLKTECLAGWLAICGVAGAGSLPAAHGQVAVHSLPPVPAAAPTSSPLPEPIYWKQDLFLIPYQWGSPAEPAAAQAVWLFVSKDRGASWQKISEANPQVRAFNYRADGEGEYWFAIRTLDRQGREWPAGPYQPELRVIVDTTIPRIEELRGQILPGGQIEISWRCSDTNLDPNSLLIEAQVDAAGAWQPIPLVNSTSALDSTSSGQVQWQSPAGVRPMAIRATVLDRAKNTATYRAELSPVAGAGAAAPPSGVGSTYGIGADVGSWGPETNQLLRLPAPGPQPPAAPTAGSSSLFGVPTPLQASTPSGWSSAHGMPPQIAAPTNQAWPAVPGRTPFRLSSVAVPTASDGVTSYGSPRVVTTPPVTPAPPPPADHGASNSSTSSSQMESQFASLPKTAEGGLEQAPTNGPRFAALDPFRQTSSVKRLPATTLSTSSPISSITSQPLPPVGPIDEQHAPPTQIKRVGSRSFALEYDLDDTGRWGVSKVELWGTRDGGKSWHSIALDDDHRSPLIVTVDEQGLYGFRIVVDIAGSAASTPPSPGDAPELWVAVDLQRPVVELTAIERGDGNLADHLIFRWNVADDNLEPRPIALFYSSRPTGPWSAIATSLEDTGEYAWRVERFVPARFYVRVEARDTAGNLAAFQTREPIDFVPLASPGHLRSAEPAGPTAAAPAGAYQW